MTREDWVSVMGRYRRRAIVVICVLGGLLGMPIVIATLFALFTPTATDRYVYPGPDRQISAVEEVTSGGGAAGWSVPAAMLIGKSEAEPIKVARHAIGGFTFRGWLDANTLAVCPEVKGDVPEPSVQVVGRDGVSRTYGIVLDCSRPRPSLH